MDICNMSALDTARMIKNRELSCEEAVNGIAREIEKKDGVYNCYTSFDKEAALKNAAEAQKLIDSGSAASPLAGVPVAIKDNICTKGQITSCGSKMLHNFKPPYDATVVKKLAAAGMVACGKVNMDEFAMGSTTETSYYGATKNPWDTQKVPGGSSGGAAAAVAARESVIALGSDTGGSIRQPCSFCGVTGLKPTYGSVSRYGLIAYASSLDQIGPIAKTAQECAAVFSVISGRDEKDGTSADPAPFSFDEVASCESLKGKRVGIPSDYFGKGINKEVASAVMQAAQTLKALGATDWTVRRIFLWHTLFIVLRGMLWGNLIGLSLGALQAWTGLVPLDPESYYTATVPMAFHWGYILALNAGTLVASFLMMVGPSVLITRISPATVMCYE